MLSAAMIQDYRRQGYLRVPGVLSSAEVEDFRSLVLASRQRAGESGADYREEALHRVVNAWRREQAFAAITFHPYVRALATTLAGCPLRLWHDQIMCKPGGSPWTFMHQGQPNWSHICRPDSRAITAWIALVDVPLEKGCMGYIPGSHRRWNLGQQMGAEVESFFDLAPDLLDAPVNFVPLKAGDVAFHHGCTAHCAAANQTSDDRIAATVNFMDLETRFRDIPHAVTDGLGFIEGDLLDDEDLFPLIQSAACVAAS